MAAEMREALGIPTGSFVLANLNMLYKLDAKIVRRDEPEQLHYTSPGLHGPGNGVALAMAPGPFRRRLWGMAAQMWPVCRARRGLHRTTA